MHKPRQDSPLVNAHVLSREVTMAQGSHMFRAFASLHNGCIQGRIISRSRTPPGDGNDCQALGLKNLSRNFSSVVSHCTAEWDHAGAGGKSSQQVRVVFACSAAPETVLKSSMREAISAAPDIARADIEAISAAPDGIR